MYTIEIMTPKEKAKELYEFNWNWLYTSADYSKTVLANCCKVLAVNTCNEIINFKLDNMLYKEAPGIPVVDLREYWHQVKNELLSYE